MKLSIADVTYHVDHCLLISATRFELGRPQPPRCLNHGNSVNLISKVLGIEKNIIVLFTTSTLWVESIADMQSKSFSKHHIFLLN